MMCYQQLVRSCDKLGFMKNAYRIVGTVVYITVETTGKTKLKKETLIDVADLDMLLHHPVKTWYAHLAKAPAGKFYVLGKEYSAETRSSTTQMLHRVLMGDPRKKSGRAIEIHHVDNDGLNNRHENMERKSHRGNIRAHWPERNWVPYDESLDRIVVFKKLVQIGKDIQATYELTRQQLWKIRTGKTLESAAAKAFWFAVLDAYPQLFHKEWRSAPWKVGAAAIKQFCVSKEKGVTAEKLSVSW
jgi:hypothetical protein